VRRVAKVAIWAAVFLGAAGIGAYIGAHTELFPPSVQGGPGTSASTSGPTPGGSVPVDPVWRGAVRSASRHELYVGGSCTTHWETTLKITTLDNGKLIGTGTARLAGRRVCTFPNAQVNAEKIDVSVEGEWDAGEFRIRLIDGDRTPLGTADYGGFAPTVFAEGGRSILTVPIVGKDSARGTVHLERVDEGGRGRYISENAVSLTCTTCDA
jgi:hypothetical protein